MSTVFIWGLRLIGVAIIIRGLILMISQMSSNMVVSPLYFASSFTSILESSFLCFGMAHGLVMLRTMNKRQIDLHLALQRRRSNQQQPAQPDYRQPPRQRNDLAPTAPTNWVDYGPVPTSVEREKILARKKRHGGEYNSELPDRPRYSIKRVMDRDDG
jgi:hypothetical protein